MKLDDKFHISLTSSGPVVTTCLSGGEVESKEWAIFLLADNLIRSTMLESARAPERIRLGDGSRRPIDDGFLFPSDLRSGIRDSRASQPDIVETGPVNRMLRSRITNRPESDYECTGFRFQGNFHDGNAFAHSNICIRESLKV